LLLAVLSGWLACKSGLTARFEHRAIEPSVPSPEAFLVEMQEVP
jgi:hypothetical protein